MSNRLIVGLDETEDGRRALTWALRYAQEAGASVHVVTAFRRESAPWAWVAGPVDEREWAQHQQDKAIAHAVAHLEPAPPVSREVAEGDPVDVLCTAAEGADLLVIGGRPHSPVAIAFLGSVATGCIRRAGVPVVVVPLAAPTPAHDAMQPAGSIAEPR